MKLLRKVLFIIIVINIIACKEDGKKSAVPAVAKARVNIPASNADSLFLGVQNQLNFGHRIPGTNEHIECRDWLVSKFESYGAQVSLQNFKASFFDKKDVDSYNIIASFNPDHANRVLLSAHWDSRMVAEKDKDSSKKASPIAGADDGGSGVAALLEVARVLKSNPIDLGIDIILFDAEDNGTSGDGGNDGSWCQGSQYWSKNKHNSSYRAKFGILVDMVGAKGATFPKEGVSMQFAKPYVDKIWQLGQRMGYSKLFIDTRIDGITDDHVFVNQYAGIPMLDIINYDVNRNTFGEYHHTHDDDISVIDKNTLRAVTQVVIATIYKVSDGSF